MEPLREQLRIGTPKELKDTAKFKIYAADGIPQEQEVFEHISENGRDIKQFILSEERVWETGYELWNEEKVPARFGVDHENYRYLCFLDRDDETGKPVVLVYVLYKDWSNDRRARMRKLFDDDFDPKQPNVSKLAKNGDIKPMGVLQVTNPDFNPTEIKDGLELDIDPEILELIRMLNMAGLKTRQSCYGHEDRQYQPYLDFYGESLDTLIALFNEWEQQGGVSHIIESFSIDALTLRVTFPQNIPMADAQRDLRGFTDFLRKKIDKPKHFLRLSIPEMRHRIGRKLQRAVRRK